ncbi:MAG: hypothetical protein F9K51_04415, partial [Candidatus Dadabacteria bacterium]
MRKIDDNTIWTVVLWGIFACILISIFLYSYTRSFDPDEIERAEPYGFNNRVGGDGAPRWVVQTCLPEKNVDGPEW